MKYYISVYNEYVDIFNDEYATPVTLNYDSLQLAMLMAEKMLQQGKTVVAKVVDDRPISPEDLEEAANG